MEQNRKESSCAGLLSRCEEFLSQSDFAEIAVFGSVGGAASVALSSRCPVPSCPKSESGREVVVVRESLDHPDRTTL